MNDDEISFLRELGYALQRRLALVTTFSVFYGAQYSHIGSVFGCWLVWLFTGIFVLLFTITTTTFMFVSHFLDFRNLY
jgi:hypothetical protein